MEQTNVEKKPMGMGKKLGIGCLGLIVVIIAIAIFGGTGDKTTTGGSITNTAESEKKTEYVAGETIKLNNHELVVSGVQQGYKSNNQFDTPQSSENEFVVMTVQFTNTGKDTVDINDFGFKLEDETGTQRGTSISGLVDGRLGVVSVAADGKTSGKLVFEAKKGSSTLKLHYSPGIFGGEAVVIKLK